jgi:hypothetical protein
MAVIARVPIEPEEPESQGFQLNLKNPNRAKDIKALRHLNIARHMHASINPQPTNPQPTTHNMQPMSEESKHQLSSVLEQEGERKVAELIKTNNVSEETLMAIINEGNDAFNSAHGRPMTYSEMRSLYG